MEQLTPAAIPHDDPTSPAGRRLVTDRRQSLHAVNLRHLGLRGRRQQFRRAGEAAGHYLDWYSTRLLLLSISIILCSCMDAFLTLNLLNLGAVELNVLMARLIETDVQTFVNAKIALTSLCVTLLVIHNNFRVFLGLTVEHMLMVILVGYVTLICYEVRLLSTLLF